MTDDGRRVGPVVFVIIDAVGSSLSPSVNGDMTESFVVIYTSTAGDDVEESFALP